MTNLLDALKRANSVLSDLTSVPLPELHQAVNGLTERLTLGTDCGVAYQPALLREVTGMGQLLRQQDGRLQALLAARRPADEDAHTRVSTACLVLAGCLSLMVDLVDWRVEGAEEAAAAVLGAAPLLTGSARLALAAGALHSSSQQSELLVNILMTGKAAADLVDAADSRRLVQAAAAAFEPAATAGWLWGVTTGLASLCKGGPLAAAVEEEGALHLMQYHASICQLLCSARLGAIRAAIAQHSVLPRLLTQQLTEHSLPAALAAVESAAGTGPQSAPGLPLRKLCDVVAEVIRAFRLRALQPAAQLYSQQQQPALLQLAQRLVAALPTDCEQDSKEQLSDAWWEVVCLLQYACSGLDGRQAALQQSSDDAEAEQQATSWAVAQCLPRLAAALPLILAGGPSVGAAAACFEQLLGEILHILTIEHVTGRDQLRQLMAGAAAALRIQVAVALQPACGSTGTPRDAEAVGAAFHLAVVVVLRGAQLAKGFTFVVADDQHLQADQLGAAAWAAAQLHAESCRLLHWWAAAAGEAAAEPLQNGWLGNGLATIGMAASKLLAAAEGQLGSVASDRRIAVLAAHWEVVQQLSLLLAPVEQGQPAQWEAEALAELAGAAPPALLVAHPQLLEGLAAAVQRQVQLEHDIDCFLGGSLMVMSHCCGSARAIAALLRTDVFSGTRAICSLPPESSPKVYSGCDFQLDVLESFALEAEAAVVGCSDSTLKTRMQAAAAALRQALPARLVPPWDRQLALQQLDRLAHCVTKAQALAAVLRRRWEAQAGNPATASAARLELAHAAATRDCANLRCPHFSGAGRKGKRCTGCHTVRYCCQECNVAGWRAGHKHVCAALAAERQ